MTVPPLDLERERSELEAGGYDDPVYTFPASFAQRRLWLVEHLEAVGAAYNESCGLRLQGHVEVQALQRCLNAIVQRHEALRTTFAMRDGEVEQVIQPRLAVPLQLLDLRASATCDAEAAAAAASRDFVRQPFDLVAGPLLRALLIHLEDHESILLFVAHHSIIDGWSMGVLLRELSQLYGADLRGLPAPLAELPVQYADFAVWQRDWLQGARLAEQAAYWEERLAGAPAALALPADRPRPAVQTYNGARQPIRLADRLVARLRTLSQAEGVTLFMTLLAAFQVLLARYTGETDIVVGSPIAGRGQAETEGLIGLFLNALLLRSDLAGDPPFDEFLRRVRETALGAYTHQDLPFELLVEQLRPARDLSRTALFQVMFVFQPAPEDALALPGVSSRPYRVDAGCAKLDLTMAIMDGRGGLSGWVEYNTDLFDAERIERFVGHYLTLLEGIAAGRTCRLSALPLLTPPEREQLLLTWNATAAAYDPDRCLQQQFEAQVQRTPDAPAALFEARQLTFAELNSRANRLARYLAHHLQETGAGPGAFVGVCLERSLEMVVALLAVLKAGAAYLPLDPAYPAERLNFMLSDAAVPLVVTQLPFAERLTGPDRGLVVVDGDDRERIARQPDANLGCAVSGSDLAYLIYTSGSTGKPKGVMVTHRNVANFFTAMDALTAPRSPGAWLAVTSISFDISVLELFWTLCRGFRVIVQPELTGAAAPPGGVGGSVAEQIRRHGVTHLQCTPSLAQALALDPDALAALRSLEMLLLGGEALPSALAELIGAGAEVRLINLYGPTETTVWSTAHPVERFGESVPIGRPVANTQLYVLDASLQPVPVGVTGELYIGGDGVARGYLNRPELTAARFIRHRFAEAGEARLYRTGDLARYRQDGNVEYLGRTDNQVKLRGFRIELGEVEAALAQQPGVEQAVVVMRDSRPSDRRLIAYVVPRGDARLDADALKRRLGDCLPAYMVPSSFVVLPALPLTPNGKVNRLALPEPVEGAQGLATASAEPVTPTEIILHDIWCELLRQEGIGAEDNFFALGGHSLLALAVLAQIEKRIGARLPAVSLFQYPTIRQLAQVVDRTKPTTPWPLVVPLQPRGTLPPLFCLHTISGEVNIYIPLVYYLGREQPVYGIRARGLDGLQEPDTDVEQMAARYVEALRAVQPSGPYYLAGYSSGAMIAYEVARQLQAAAQDVRLLVNFDQPAEWDAYARPALSVRWLLRFLKDLPEPTHHWLAVDRGAKKDSIKRMFSVVRSCLSRHGGQRSPDAIDRGRQEMIERLGRWLAGDPALLSDDSRRMIAAQYSAWVNYQPGPYPGRLTLFRASRQPPLCSHDPLMGWGTLAAGGVEVHCVPGVHFTLLEGPEVPVLAERLAGCLAAARQGQGAATPSV